MSTGMLGNNDTLRAFWGGPCLTLLERINGPEGEKELESLNRYLRKENPWPEKLAKGKSKPLVLPSTNDLPTFTITLGDGRTAEQLYLSGHYIIVDKYDQRAKDFVLSTDFKLSRTKEDVKLVYVEFSYDPTSDQVLARFEELGLDRPEPEDALRFGEKYPDEQNKNLVVFLHKPWRCPDGDQYVLVLFRDGSERGLSCYWFVSRWGQQCRFVARRRQSL